MTEEKKKPWTKVLLGSLLVSVLIGGPLYLVLDHLSSPVNQLMERVPALLDEKNNWADEDVDVKTQWDLSALYPTLKSAQAQLLMYQEKANQLSSYQAQLENADMLANALADYLWLEKTGERLLVYSSLLKDTNLEDAAATDFESTVSAQLNKARQKMIFISVDIKKLPESFIDQMTERLTLEEAELLSLLYGDRSQAEDSEVQKLLKLLEGLSDSYENTYKDIWGRFEVDDQANYAQYYSENEKKRKEAVMKSMVKQRTASEILASNLEGQMKYDNALAAAYGYDDAIEFVLDQDGMQRASFDAYISTTQETLNVLHRYMEMKKEAMLLNRPLAFYDLHMSVSEQVTEWPLSKATQAIVDSTSPLGKEYSQMIQKAFDERWIDVYPRSAKYDGAYTWGAYGTHPYILMNYTDTLNSVETLAHELGHAANTHLSMLNQSFLMKDNGVLKAEIAATTNEVLFLESQLKQVTSKEQRLELLEAYAELIVGTTYEQMKSTEFELAIHEAVASGKNLDSEFLNKKWMELTEKYYGEAYLVSEFDELGWAKLDHLYWNYYMYKYATGLSAGYNLAIGLLSGDESLRKDYMAFLSSGSSEDPLLSLKSMGIDVADGVLLKKLYLKLGELLDEIDSLRE